MQEKSPSLLQYAMNYGLVVGIYYIAKFCLFPLSIHSTFAGMLFIGLTLMVPILVYQLTRHYRDRYFNGNWGFVPAFYFIMMTMLFGALIAAVGHYIYFAFIDHGAAIQGYLDALEQMQQTATVGMQGAVEGATEEIVESNTEALTQMQAQLDLLKESVKQIATLSPIQMTIQLLVSNFLWSSMLALPIAFLLSMRRNTPKY